MKTPENWKWRASKVAGGPAVVFDIDGVLSDASGRHYFLNQQPKDWKGFFAACGKDPLIEDSAKILKDTPADVTVILLTGRPTAVQSETVEWLEKHNVRWDVLIMRPYGSYSKALEFKQQTVRKLKADGFELQHAYEDDIKNLEMFESEGVPSTYIDSGYYAERDAAER